MADKAVEMRPKLAQITEFLKCKRVATIGVSRSPNDFTRTLAAEFKKKGYDVVPVNPGASEIGGDPCFAHVQDVKPPVVAALVLTPAVKSEQVVRDCAEAGVKQVWLYRASGAGAVSKTAVDFCREHGIDVIAGECPMMFLAKPGFPHRVHGWVNKILGRYPG